MSLLDKDHLANLELVLLIGEIILPDKSFTCKLVPHLATRSVGKAQRLFKTLQSKSASIQLQS